MIKEIQQAVSLFRNGQMQNRAFVEAQILEAHRDRLY